MSEQSKLSTTKVPVFNENKKDFTMWWEKFQAYAGVKKNAKCTKCGSLSDDKL